MELESVCFHKANSAYFSFHHLINLFYDNNTISFSIFVQWRSSA